jgi:acetyl esterase
MHPYVRKLRDGIALAPSVLRASAIDRAAHTFARVRYALPDARPSRFHVDVQRDVPYLSPGSHSPNGRGEAHLLDVYVPARVPRPLPVVMYVHGGAFCMLSKDTHYVMAMSIARRGYLVFNINYRLGPRHRYPAPLEDACEALLWVARHCGGYGGDPSRIAVAGESAGGNLVTALTVAASYRRPEPFARRVYDASLPLRATIATYPFLDMAYTESYLANPKMPRWAKALLMDAAVSYLGPDVKNLARSAPLASPLTIIERERPDRPLPPFFLSVGTKDPLIRCSKRLKAALDAHGVPAELHISPGEMHGYDALVWREPARKKWLAAHEFLTRHLRGTMAA